MGESLRLTQNDTIHALIALIRLICSISRMDKMPSLSVIIPCLEPGPSLERLLNTLGNQLLKNIEILVVFNRASNAGEKIVSKYGGRFFTAPSVGVNIARNLGLANATAPIALLLDDDCAIKDYSF